MSMDRNWGLAVLIAGMLTTAVWAQAKPAKNSAPAKNVPVNQTAAVSATAEAGDVMAVVDGVALPMSALNDILVFSYGLPMARELIATELVRQEAVRRNVVVGLEDVQAEHELTLRLLLFPMIPDARQRDQAFAMYMEEGRVTQKQWDLTMERNAVLRKLAQGRVKITEEDLQHAFGMKFNRQAVVRHIQTASLADAEAVMKDLAAGAEFEKLVQTRSLSPSRQREGLLDPISAQSPGVPPALKEAALAMTKIGQLSNIIQAGTTYHILKLEKIIEPEKVKFEDVKEGLRKMLFEEMVQQQQMDVLRDLIQQAEEQKKIRYVNPILADLDRQAKSAGPGPAE